MKLGFHLLNDGIGFERIRDIAIESENAGFESFWVLDHFNASPKPTGEKMLECWTVLSALSTVTKKLRLGVLVLNINNRNPALLAKMAATLDEISKGRLEFGIGAGGTRRAERQKELGYEYEFIAYGIEFPMKPSIRIEKLDEGLSIIKKMWTQEYASYDGKYYSINNAVCEPKPIQKPHPPIWIGGQTGRKMLQIVSKYADGWNIMGASSLEDYKSALDKLETACEGSNRDFSKIKTSLKPKIELSNYKKEFEKFDSEGLDLAIIRAPKGMEIEYIRKIDW